MIDIHNHILPGIDDGPVSMDIALQLVDRAIEQGITGIICTPHIHPRRYDNDVKKIKKIFDNFRNEVVRRGCPVSLGYAAEVRVSDELFPYLNEKRLPFIGEWEGFSAILLEMPHAKVPVGMEELISWFYSQQIQPIIAHPERNKELMARPENILPLVKRGAVFQLTAGSLVGYFGKKAQDVSDWLLDKNLVTFIASDAHHPKRRPPAMAPAREKLVKTRGQALADQLTIHNPLKLTKTILCEKLCLAI